MSENKIVDINKKSYQVGENEFNIISNSTFPVLILPEKVGYFERISSLLNELLPPSLNDFSKNEEKNIHSIPIEHSFEKSDIQQAENQQKVYFSIEEIDSLSSKKTLENTYKQGNTLLCINPTHGGFVPIQCSPHFDTIFVYFDNKYDFSEENMTHRNNIERNIETHECKNIHFIDNIQFQNLQYNNLIIFTENENIDWSNIINSKNGLPIILTLSNEELIKSIPMYYSISNTNLYLYLPVNYYEYFKKEFYYYLDSTERILNYDNLIHLCIMVKNAGDQFENMLTQNLPIIDRWTILDTGSTDNTIDIIKKVLVGKKKGNLYQEPFLNFRDSRNRLLDLAGTNCKYTIMLDDTYVVEGNLKAFLHNNRDDQFTDSLSMYVKSNDMEYSSNRILKTDRKLRYIYRLHEIIEHKNNINAIVPIQLAKINDFTNEYMNNRTNERKEYDLRILLEEAELEPDNSRHLYYIAQTYNLLQKPELAYTYFLKRAYHEDKGYVQERVDSLFEAARIAKYKLNMSWDIAFNLYKECYELDPSRPDAMYFIGMHYYFERNINIAFSYFKKAFEIGYPVHCQFSLKPTLSFYFLPKYLAELCYGYNEYELGQSACELFLSHHKTDVEFYNLVSSWHTIYTHLNQLNQLNQLKNEMVEKSVPTELYIPSTPYIVIVYDGDPNTFTNVEKYIERNQENSYYQFVVFSPSCEMKLEKGIVHLDLQKYISFLSQNKIHNTIIFNLLYLLPVTFKSNVENVGLHICNTEAPRNILKHGMIIPIDPKLRKIICYSELDRSIFTSIFENLREKVKMF